MPQLTNWARNVVFTPARFERPRSVDEVQELVARADRARVLGTGHSFSEVAATDGLLLSLADLPPVVEVDPDAKTVRVGAGARFGDIMGPLHEAEMALHNTGSLPHISVAGACATGTHGSGNTLGNLASAVVELEVVRADGQLRRVRGDDPDFAGSVVSLGLLGVVTSLVLRVQPAYDIRQYVYDNLPLEALVDNFEEVMGSAYSVSAFTHWRGPVFETVWRKQLADAPEAPAEWLGAHLAGSARHMIEGMPTENATEQLGVPGGWHERLPHFRLEFTPSSGDEIQTEYLLPREQGPAAITALNSIRDVLSPALHVSEIRTIAADQQWMSAAYDRDSVGLHFTWVRDMAVVRPALQALEDVLLDLDARPHWGKVFLMERARVRSRFPRISDFEALVRAQDPTGKFGNAFLAQYLDLPGQG